MSMNQEFWPNWVDCLGQEYKTGDLVAIAVTGQGPEVVIGMVKSINKTTRTGEPIEVGFGKSRQPSCSVTVENIVRSGNYQSPFKSRPANFKTMTYDNPWRIVKIRSGEGVADSREVKDAIEDLKIIEFQLREAA